MVADGEWELIRQQGRIMGVASRSTDKPIKVAGFTEEQNGFEGATKYSEWRFLSAGDAASSAQKVAAKPSKG